MYSSYGNCEGCQERSWHQVPRMISSPAISIRFFRIFTLQQKSHLCIPLLGIARAARRGLGTKYRAWSPALQSGCSTLQQKSHLCIPLMGIARAARRGRKTRYRAWSPALQSVFVFSGFLHCNKNPIYVFLFWELRGLPGEVLEPGTAHDFQPCNQDLVHCSKNPIYVFLLWELRGLCMISSPAIRIFLIYTATKISFMYSSSGNCVGCQERSWNQVPRMISSPAIRNFFF